MTSLTIDKRKISDLVREQFPAFYRNDGETFIAFVEAYQEWLDQQQLEYKIADYADVDKTLDKFLGHFRAEFLSMIPAQIAGDQRLLMKHVLDLYRSKGSKQGYKLLFRLLYNQDIEVYVPGDDMLAPSDGEWYEPYYLEITPNDSNKTLIGRKIVGAASEAEAIVETYIRQPVNGKIVDILYISGKVGNFIVGEKVGDVDTIRSINVLDAPTVLGSLSYISFIQGGQNFITGQRLKVITGDGIEGEVRISNTANGTGTLLFTIVNGGSGYSMDAEEIITRTEPANASIRGRGGAFDVGALSDVQEITYDTSLLYNIDPIIIANTSVNAFELVAGGLGYSNGTSLTITNDRGVESIYVVNSGSNYTNADIVVVGGPGTDVEANVVTYSNGSVHYVVVHNTGKGFTSTPTVTITSTLGNGVVLQAQRTGATGSGASGTITTYSDGSIQSITKTGSGSGYQMPPVITVAGGSGAVITCNTYDTDYSFNEFYEINANSAIGNGTPIQSKFFGRVAALTNIATGNNYQSPPTVKLYDFIHTNILPGNIFFSATSNVVIGVNTSFTTFFDANTANTAVHKNKIKLIANPGDESTNTEHRIIVQVTNNTHMILDDFPQYTCNGELKDVGISDGGSGYQNTDSVSVSGAGGSGANVTITTDNFGTIIDVNIFERGTGWRSPPTVAVTSNTGVGANLISEIYYGVHRKALHLMEVNYQVIETLQPDQTNSGNNAVITADPVYGTGIIRLGTVKNSGFGYNEDETVQLATFGAISTITIKSGGTLYKNNDNIVVTGGGGGFGGAGFVTTNANGTITAVTLTSPGSGYIVPPTIKVRSTTGRSAEILCEVGGLNTDYFVNGVVHLDGQGRLQGQWMNTKGFLNADKYIQDSYYYQEFSYELRTGMTLSHYADIIRQLYHPAGMELFGSVVITKTVENTLTEDSITVSG